MSEHQPIVDIQEDLENAAKIRELINTPGWKDIILPDIERAKAEVEEQILSTEWNSSNIDLLISLRARRQYIEEFISSINRKMTWANEIIREEAQKEYNKEPFAGSSEL